MIADGAEDLFRRAILQSAPLGIQRGRAAMSRAMGVAARGALGADPETVDAPRTCWPPRPPSAAAAAGFGTSAQMPFGPQTGHHPLPADDRGRRPAPRGGPARARDDRHDGRRRAAVPDAQPAGGADARRPGGRVAGATTPRRRTSPTRLFAAPAAAFAKQHRRGGGHAMTYVFDWQPADSPFGACHCIELPFLMGSFDDWARSPMLGSDPRQALAELGPPMRQLWCEFARGMFDDADAHLRLPGTLGTRLTSGRRTASATGPSAASAPGLGEAAAAAGRRRAG